MSLIDKLSEDREEEERTDFFEDEAKPEEPKPKKKPALKPDDPEYWQQEESQWEHLKPRRRTAWRIYLIVALLIVVFIIAFRLRYFSPYIENADEYGYIERLDERGTIFKTFEGVLIPYRELHDTTRIYSRDFIFSITDRDLAIKMKKLERLHKPVRVGYKQYHATVPWRGSSKIVVTEVDTVDARTILPPEFRPEIAK